MPGETKLQKAQRLALASRAAQSQHASKIKRDTKKRPATAKQLADRRLVVKAYNEKVAKLNAAGRNAATRASITPPAVSQGVSAITNALTPRKKPRK
jgi:hypothetical protein